MLTQQQKAEAEKKLKDINEQLTIEEKLKSDVKKSTKAIFEAINSMSNDPKKQLQVLKNLANNVIPQKILSLDANQFLFQEMQDKMKSEKEKFSREAIALFQEKQRIQGGIDQIKKTILNIQKTVKQSVQEQVKKRKKIEDDLEKSLDDIRNKISQFEKESEVFDKQNAQLKQKIQGLKSKLNGIEQDFKKKADQKDDEVKKQKEELTDKLKLLQIQVQKATQLNKQYSGVEKKNFDNKLSLYLRTKKFPQFSSSFESSAKTLNSCKQQLMKGVTRLNIANQTIQKSQKDYLQSSNQFLVELKRQKQKQTRLQEIRKQKESVRSKIILLQKQIKEKKALA